MDKTFFDIFIRTLLYKIFFLYQKSAAHPGGRTALVFYSALKKDKVILSFCLSNIVARIAMPVSPFSKDFYENIISIYGGVVKADIMRNSQLGTSKTLCLFRRKLLATTVGTSCILYNVAAPEFLPLHSIKNLAFDNRIMRLPHHKHYDRLERLVVLPNKPSNKRLS